MWEEKFDEFLGTRTRHIDNNIVSIIYNNSAFNNSTLIKSSSFHCGIYELKKLPETCVT